MLGNGAESSFHVAWIERRYENGQLATTERWTAILTVVIQPPRDAERLRANPLGVYVHAINWSRENAQSDDFAPSPFFSSRPLR